ncbi:DOMON domain-containing protein, partial [Penaeus vannamei]
IDFGNVRVPARLDYPRPQKIDALPTFEHGVSSDRIVVVDAQTFLIPNFSYDGQAPDGHFWVGKGATPGPSGNMVPDENGSEEPLKRYSGKTIVITLPGDQTVFDIDHLSVWCRAFFADFGHVRVPKNLNVPPSLKMLGVAPQTKLNCEVLWDDLAFEVRWAVAGESIVMQLVGRIAPLPSPNPPNPSHSQEIFGISSFSPHLFFRFPSPLIYYIAFYFPLIYSLFISPHFLFPFLFSLIFCFLSSFPPFILLPRFIFPLLFFLYSFLIYSFPSPLPVFMLLLLLICPYFFFPSSFPLSFPALISYSLLSHLLVH